MKTLHILFKSIVTLLATLIASVAIYFLVAFIFLLFPANKDFDQNLTAEDAVKVFVISNGIHTDLAFPIVSEQFDWREIFSPDDLSAISALINSGEIKHLAVGWGDRDFYLNTPSWSDLSLATTFNAISGGGETLLHVTYLRESQFPAATYELSVTPDQYQRLIGAVISQLGDDKNNDERNDETTRAKLLANSGYSKQDTFYQARGSYNLVTTCNTWTGTVLADAGIKVSRWTPFPVFVTWYLSSR